MYDKEMLKEILEAYGPSGREQEVSRVIRRYVQPLSDEVYTDALGNLIAVKKGSSGKKIMLSAHMDQIGLVVVDIDEKGFLRVSNVGGVNPVIAVARPVRFENGTRGVTYFETKKHSVKDTVMQELFIDIGAESRQEAEAKVQIGDVAVYAAEFTEMGNRISCGALDDRIACAAVIEALRTMKSEHSIYAVFTVQEEVGLRGAGAAAYSIAPDLNISLDVTGTGDMPECSPMSVALGAGAAIKVMDSSVIVPPVVRDFLEEAAEEQGIAVQREVLRGGGTDTGAVQRTAGGILSGCISIPCRYIHSPVETADLRDYRAAVQLLCAAVAKAELPDRHTQFQ